MDLEEEGIGRRDHLEVRTVQEGVIQSRREFLRHFQAADLVQRVVQEPTLQVLLNSKDVSNIPRWLDSVSEEPPVLDMAKVAPEMAKIVARNFEEVLICCADSENFEPSSLLQTISQRKNKNKVMKEELHHLKVRQAELLRAIIKKLSLRIQLIEGIMSSHVMSTRDVCIENRIRCMELSCHCSKVLIERTRLQLLCARLGDVPLFSEQVQQSLASHLYTSEKNLMFINEQLSQYTGHPHFEHLAQLADQSRALSHELESLRSQIQSRKNHSRQLFT